MSHRCAAWFIHQIRPWLRIRDRQADRALQFAELVQRARLHRPVPTENAELRRKLSREISAINKQGRQEIPALSSRVGPPQLSSLPTELKIYLAGLFDGEGCVVIGRDKNKPSIWFLRAVTAITDGIALRGLYDATGCAGNFAVRRTKKKIAKRKAIYQWAMSGRTARWFLYQILPWLLIRERQARAGLMFAAAAAFAKGKPPTLGNMVAKEFYKRQIHDMNRRGRASPYPTSDFVPHELALALWKKAA